MVRIRNYLDYYSYYYFNVYAIPSFALLYSIDEIIDQHLL